MLPSQAGGSLVYASDFFVNYAVYCKRESGASLSMALVKNEVLATAVNGCYGLAEGLKSEFWHQNLGEDSSGSPNIPYDSVSRFLCTAMHQGCRKGAGRP